MRIYLTRRCILRGSYGNYDPSGVDNSVCPRAEFRRWMLHCGAVHRSWI